MKSLSALLDVRRMNRKLALDDRALRRSLGRAHMALANIDAFDDYATFLREDFQNLARLALVVTGNDNDIIILLDVELDLFNACFHG